MDRYSWSSALRVVNCLLLICAATAASAAVAQADPAETLRAKYASLDQALQQNQFKRPLVLNSTETPSQVTGDVYAVVAYPFGAVKTGLNDPGHWCDVMVLHIS